MRAPCILAVVLAGCVPDTPSLDVAVTSARTGVPLKDAVVAVACQVPALGGAARTDERGHAHVEVDTDELEPCVVTVSHPDFATARRFDLDLCPAGYDCATLSVALDELVAP